MKKRCEWCGSDPLYVMYHDDAWGVPIHDGRRLFEMLILEGAQTGLSWLTILRKRENYRKSLHNFNFEKITAYPPPEIERLLGDPGTVRNRLKLESAVKNARGTLAIIEGFGSLDIFVWHLWTARPFKMNGIPQVIYLQGLNNRMLWAGI